MAVVKNLMVRAGADFSGMKKEMAKANKSLADFKSSVGRTVKAIGAITAAIGIGKLFSDSIAEANEAMVAEAKLVTIMRQRMNATDDMIASVKDLADAQEAVGVVGGGEQIAGAQELSTYLSEVRNLKTLIPVMNNLVAQQYGVSASAEQVTGMATMLGKVMDGQVGALSRYGFTFDEAQEKILKYGSEAQRAALLADIVTDSLGNMNEALGRTPQGQMARLRHAIGGVKEEIGRGLMPLIQAVLPWINMMVGSVLRAAQAFSSFMHALFGVKTEVQAISQQTASVSDLGDAYDKAGKKAKKARKSVGSFDNLNLVGGNDAGGEEDPSAGIGGGGFDAGMDGGLFGGLGESMSQVSDKAVAMAEKVKRAFATMKDFIVRNKDIIIAALVGLGAAFVSFYAATKWTTIVSALTGGAKQIGGAFKLLRGALGMLLTPAGLIAVAIGALVAAFVYFYRTNEQFRGIVDGILTSIADAAVWLWESVLVPFGEWLGSVMVAAWELIGKAAVWLWDKVLKPMGSWLGSSMVKAWEVVKAAAQVLWQQVLVPFGNFLLWIWKNAIVPLAKVLGEVLATAFKFVADVAKSFWNNVLVPLGKALSEMFKPAVEAVNAVLEFLWQKVLKPLAAFIADTVISVFKTLSSFVAGALKAAFEGFVKVVEFLWKNVLQPVAKFVGGIFYEAFDNVFRSIGTIISGLKTSFIGLMNFITGVFTGNWTKAWEGVRDVFRGIFESLWGFVKLPLNNIISGINTLIRGINSIKIDVPKWVGKIPGIPDDITSFGFSVPEIPKLAKGGLAYGPTLAVVGDNRGAAANPEVIAPLKTLEGMMDRGADNRQVVSALQELIKVTKTKGGDVVLQVGKTEIARVVAAGANDIQRRTGKSIFAT